MAAPVLLALAGVLNIDLARLRGDLTRTPGPVWVLLAFAAWAAASSFWSPYHNHGQALRLWGTLVPGLLLVLATQRDAASRRWTRWAGLAAVIVLMALLALEAAFDMPLNRAFNHTGPTWQIERNPGRGVSMLLAMVWASAGVLVAAGGVRRWLAFAVLATAGVLSAQFEDYANLAAFLLGLIAFGLGLLVASDHDAFDDVGPSAMALSGAVRDNRSSSPTRSSWTRCPIPGPRAWASGATSCGRIAQQPILGSGMDASRAVTDTITVRDVTLRAVQLHPHSGSLQIWFEAGGVAAVLGAGAFLWGGWIVSRRVAANRAHAAAICATFAALGTIANISYGAWQEWWDATLIIGACLLLAIGAKPAEA